MIYSPKWILQAFSLCGMPSVSRCLWEALLIGIWLDDAIDILVSDLARSRRIELRNNADGRYGTGMGILDTG